MRWRDFVLVVVITVVVATWSVLSSGCDDAAPAPDAGCNPFACPRDNPACCDVDAGAP